MHARRRRGTSSDEKDIAPVQRVRVFKSGNSLAIRIPGGMAKQLELLEGTTMEIGVDRDQLWLKRVSTLPTLQELVDSIDPEDVHPEQFPGLVGKERW
jgi:antitoxin component of MazEF toxin-antitoxin module